MALSIIIGALSHSGQGTRSNNNPGAASGSGPAQQSSTDTSIKQFLALKKPSNFYEQIACLAYYLEKIQGVDGFNTKEITKLNTDARTTKIPHSSMYVKNTVSQYGYLSPLGGGKKALTVRGEALVEALPDKEKVKQALEEHPFRGKSKKKKQKEKK